jgi:uncharacterized protein (DUF433 family)
MGDATLLKRITAKPEVFGGKPIIRGMPIPVATIPSLLAQAEVFEAILTDDPGLELDDVRACLAPAEVVGG